jgi:hypothetical protein
MDLEGNSSKSSSSSKTPVRVRSNNKVSLVEMCFDEEQKQEEAAKIKPKISTFNERLASKKEKLKKE